MVVCNTSNCPNCGGRLKFIGRVKRIVRTKCGQSYKMKIRRLICTYCGKIHRELPDYLVPYKHYTAEIIKGFIFGTITSDDLDYEDYPCETTIKDWKKSQKNHFL